MKWLGIVEPDEAEKALEKLIENSEFMTIEYDTLRRFIREARHLMVDYKSVVAARNAWRDKWLSGDLKG